MPVGWLPDPTPTRVEAPGWGTAVPVPSDPLVEVGWWAVVGLDMGLASVGTGVQMAQFGLTRTMAFAQMAVSSQSMALRKIATLQFTQTATPTQALAIQRIVTEQMAATAPATQALGLVKVIGLALAATGAASQALGLARVGTLALAATADPSTALALTKVATETFSSSVPATQALATLKIALVAMSPSTPLAGGAAFLGYPPTAEVTTVYDVAGTYTYTIPRWCDWIDAVPLGGGQAGTNGSFVNGQGGSAGKIATQRWTRGLHIPFDALTMTVVVGGLSGGNGSNGKPSTVTVNVTGGLVLQGDGGSGGQGVTNPVGQGVTAVTFNGVTYSGGGSQGALNNQGNPPGGGGAGGGFASAGGQGAIGKVWLRAGQG